MSMSNPNITRLSALQLRATFKAAELYPFGLAIFASDGYTVGTLNSLVKRGILERVGRDKTSGFMLTFEASLLLGV